MPVALNRSDRKLLLTGAVVVFLLAVAIVFFSPDSDEEEGFPSSFSAKRHGAKAAFLLLQESGYQVERWIQSPANLPQQPAGTLLIVAEPQLSPEKKESEALKKYLQEGGRILAIGARATLLLPEGDAARLDEPEFEWKPVSPTLPSRITRGGPITMPMRYKWKPDLPEHLVHYAVDDGAVVVSYRHGAGEVIWWADDLPITNAGINRKGNLDLLLNCIGDGTTRILWDEYFHQPRQSLWSRVSDTPLSWMLLQAGLVALALVFTYSRRSGPLHPLIEESRLSPLEFVETLGALYKRGGAAGFAVEVAYGRFRQLLARRLGVRRDLDRDALVRAARERLGHKGNALADVLRECEAAARNSELADARAVELVQQLNHFARELQLITPRAQEKH